MATLEGLRFSCALFCVPFYHNFVFIKEAIEFVQYLSFNLYLTCYPVNFFLVGSQCRMTGKPTQPAKGIHMLIAECYHNFVFIIDCSVGAIFKKYIYNIAVLYC